MCKWINKIVYHRVILPWFFFNLQLKIVNLITNNYNSNYTY